MLPSSSTSSSSSHSLSDISTYLPPFSASSSASLSLYVPPAPSCLTTSSLSHLCVSSSSTECLLLPNVFTKRLSLRCGDGQGARESSVNVGRIGDGGWTGDQNSVQRTEKRDTMEINAGGNSEDPGTKRKRGNEKEKKDARGRGVSKTYGKGKGKGRSNKGSSVSINGIHRSATPLQRYLQASIALPCPSTSSMPPLSLSASLPSTSAYLSESCRDGFALEARGGDDIESSELAGTKKV